MLSLQHEQIPSTCISTTLNPHIDWGGMPVEIPLETLPWRRGERKAAGRRELVRLQRHQCPRDRRRSAASRAASNGKSNGRWHILAMSARSETALRTLVERYPGNWRVEIRIGRYLFYG